MMIRLILLSCCIFTAPLQAASLPVNYPLSPFTEGTSQVDRALEAWLNDYADKPHLLDQDPAEIDRKSRGLDPVVIAVLQLNYISENGASSAEKQLKVNMVQIRQLVESSLKKIATKQPVHELTFDLLFLFNKLGFPDADLKKSIDIALQNAPPYGWAKKNYLFDLISSSANLDHYSSEEMKNILGTIKEYQNNYDKRRVLETIMTKLSPGKREPILEHLVEVAKDTPLLFKKFKWLGQGLTQEKVETKIAERNIQELTKHRQCAEAEKAYMDLFNQGMSWKPQEAIMVGSLVERCWRSQKRTEMFNFWDRVQPVVEGKLGESGAVHLALRKSYVYWSEDLYSEAKRLAEFVLAKSQTLKDTVAWARAIFILGKIAEHQDNFNLATDFFRTYLRSFADQEDFEFALTSLVIIYAEKKNWQGLAQSLKPFVDIQYTLSMDARPVGATAFSLFWLGRSYLSIGQKDLAKEMWRRLATEYYSTFYGAMGHFLLEKISAKSLTLEPSRTLPFDFQRWMNTLPERDRYLAQRALYYLRFGMSRQARGDIEEIKVTPDNPASNAVKSLLLFANGQLLETIKLYDSMPRSFRASLPVGMERLVFPIRYTQEIKELATKRNLDPDLVFALIRQESVFNKDALSPVGAMGLMQLMPETAKSEYTKMHKDFVNEKRRSEIAKLLKSEAGLKNPSANLALGIHHLSRLLSNYSSPVYALASYNASPSAVQKWQNTIPKEDVLVFIERIPYKETRSYVKLVLRNYFYYKKWYNTTPSSMTQKHLDHVASSLLAQAGVPVHRAEARPKLGKH